MMMMHCDRVHAPVVTQRERRFVQNAEQQLPQRVRRFLNFVKQQNRQFQFLCVPLVERFLRQQRMRLPVSQVSRRRADQLRNFVRVLELRAIDLDAGAGVPKSDSAIASTTRVLPEPVGPRNKQVPYRTSGRVQTGQKHLVDLRNFLDGLVLADDLAAKSAVKLTGVMTATGRIEYGAQIRSHRVWARFGFGPLSFS